MRKNNRLLLVSLLLLQHSPSALSASCTVSTTSVNFGSYDVFNTSPVLTTGTVTVTCTPVGSSYTISLNSGLHGTINQRYMAQAGGTDTLLYGLYLDPTRTTNWGDGTGNSSTLTNTANTPNQIYAMAPGGQDVSAGSYSDILTVTVTF